MSNQRKSRIALLKAAQKIMSGDAKVKSRSAAKKTKTYEVTIDYGLQSYKYQRSVVRMTAAGVAKEARRIYRTQGIAVKPVA